MIVCLVKHEDGRRKARENQRKHDRKKQVVTKEFCCEPDGPEQNDDCQHTTEDSGQKVAEE